LSVFSFIAPVVADVIFSWPFRGDPKKVLFWSKYLFVLYDCRSQDEKSLSLWIYSRVSQGCKNYRAPFETVHVFIYILIFYIDKPQHIVVEGGIDIALWGKCKAINKGATLP